MVSVFRRLFLHLTAESVDRAINHREILTYIAPAVNVRFGSLADLFTNSSLMSAFERIADVQTIPKMTEL